MRGTDSERSNVVSNTALSPHPLTRTALILAPRSAYLVTGALAFVALAWFLAEGLVGIAALAVAGTLAALAAVITWLSLNHARSHGALQDQIAAFIDNDASPSFTTDVEGEIGTQNRAALQRFGSRGGQTLTRALAEVFANPAAVLHRLQNRADALGAAREDLVTRRGHVRLSVHKIGEAGFLWRLEDMAERAVGGRGAETISLPMMTVSKSGTILFMNEATRRLIGERVKTLDRIFTDLPLRPGEEHAIAAALWFSPVRSLQSFSRTKARPVAWSPEKPRMVV